MRVSLKFLTKKRSEFFFSSLLNTLKKLWGLSPKRPHNFFGTLRSGVKKIWLQPKCYYLTYFNHQKFYWLFHLFRTNISFYFNALVPNSFLPCRHCQLPTFLDKLTKPVEVKVIWISKPYQSYHSQSWNSKRQWVWFLFTTRFQLKFTCSKSTIETVEKVVKYVQS